MNLRRLASLALLSVYLALPAAARAQDAGPPVAVVDAGAPPTATRAPTPSPPLLGVTTSPGAKLEPCVPTSQNPCITDPGNDPLAFVSDAHAIEKRVGLVWGLVLVLYVGLKAFSRKNDEDHWTNKPFVLAAVPGAIGVLAALIDWGLDKNGSVVVVGAALMKFVLLLLPSHGRPAPANTLAAKAGVAP